MSNRRKLLVALGACAFVVMGLLGHLTWSGYRNAIDAAKATTRGYASILEARLDATLNRADSEVQDLLSATPLTALNQDAVSRNAQLGMLLKTRVSHFPELSGLFIYDVNGDVLYASDTRATPPNIGTLDYFRMLRDDPRVDFAMSETIVAGTDSQPFITLVRSVRDEQGAFLGVVTAEVQIDRIEKLFQSLDVGPQGNVALYRRDDFRLVLRWPETRARLNVALPPEAPVRNILAGGSRTATAEFTAAADGVARIYSFHVLDPYPYFVSVGIARDEVLAGWRTRWLSMGLALLLLVGLLMVLVRRLWRADSRLAGLAAIVETSNDAIVSRDTAGRILSWNRSAEVLFGYSAAEMMGCDINMLVPPALHHELMSSEEMASVVSVQPHDSVRLTKDGRLVDVSVSASPIRDADGSVYATAMIFRDITERKRSESTKAQLAAIVESSEDAIISRAPDDTIISWNAAAERIFGWRKEEALGKPFRRLLSRIPDTPVGRFEKVLHGESQPWFEDLRPRKDGTRIHVQTTLSPVKDEHGQILFVSCIMRDVTARVMADQKIEQLATQDALTGLPNRSMLMQQMNTFISRAARTNTQLVVMFIDLDRFKDVNDTLGHAAGDDLLRECAKRLTACVRGIDIVARLGGDEFVVLLTDVTDTAIVSPIADRMLKLLTTPYQVHRPQAVTSASIGICFYPADGNGVDSLMKNADIAMYHAKALGRNNYQFFAEEMNQRMMQRLQLEGELRSAVQNNEFLLHYQPQVSIATGEVQGAESLVRWQHPTRGLLYPVDFIPLAEETGLILPIGEWVLNHACRTIKAWRAEGVNIPYIVVNVAAAQLGEGLVQSVRQALVDHGIEAGWLVLEITETMLMEHVEEAISILRRIRELGIRIAMDDFGTGYSSLSVLQRVPLDTLKIDQSFVKAIDDEAGQEGARSIIGAIVAIAKELRLSVVAEGVESTTQLAFLRTLNCDTYQGYLYGVPVSTIALATRFAAPAKSTFDDHKDVRSQ